MSEENNHQLENELNPTAPPDGLITRWQRQSERRKNGDQHDPRTTEPHDLESGATLKSDHNEPTNLERAPDSNHYHEPQLDQLDPRSTQLERLLRCAHRATICLNPEGLPL